MLGEAIARRACLVLAALLIVALAALAGLRLHGQAEVAKVRAELAEARQTHANFVAEAEARARQASEAARAEEQRRQEAQSEIVHIAKMAAARDAAAGARRAVAAERVRQRAADLAAQCGGAAGDPAAATRSPAAVEAGALLADMLGRLEAAAGELATIADNAIRAGSACEAAHDSLVMQGTESGPRAAQ